MRTISIKWWNPWIVPSYAKLYVAPFLRDGALSSLFGQKMEDGKGVAQLSFLCERAARLVANAVKKEQEADILRRGLLDYQVAEILMRDALMDLSKRGSWDVHTDVGPAVLLGASSRFGSEEQTRYKDGTMIPLVAVKDEFRGKFFTKKISEMEENTMYWSLSHNTAVAECLAVDHEKKVVFAFQSTAQDPSKHAFNASTLLRVMQNIGMGDAKYKKYKLKIVVFANISRERTHGCAFHYDLEDVARENIPKGAQGKDSIAVTDDEIGKSSVSVGGGQSSVAVEPTSKLSLGVNSKWSQN